MSAARARVATRAEAVALPRRCDRRAAEAGAEATRAQAVVCIAGEVCVQSVGDGPVDGLVTNGESVGDARAVGSVGYCDARLEDKPRRPKLVATAIGPVTGRQGEVETSTVLQTVGNLGRNKAESRARRKRPQVG